MNIMNPEIVTTVLGKFEDGAEINNETEMNLLKRYSLTGMVEFGVSLENKKAQAKLTKRGKWWIKDKEEYHTEKIGLIKENVSKFTKKEMSSIESILEENNFFEKRAGDYRHKGEEGISIEVFSNRIQINRVDKRIVKKIIDTSNLEYITFLYRNINSSGFLLPVEDYFDRIYNSDS